MSGDERKILDFLKLNPKLFHSLNEIRRHLNRQLSCEATEEGIWPSVKRLLNKDLIESDAMCHFRFKRDTELEPLKTQVFLSPRMQQILKKTNEVAETYDITPEEPDDNLTKPPPLN